MDGVAHQEQQFISSLQELAIVSAASCVGQLELGCERFPWIIIGGGLPGVLENQWKLEPYGDISFSDCTPLHGPPSTYIHLEQKEQITSEVTRDISQRVYNQAAQGRRVLTLGGDHSIAIGSVSGIARAVHQQYAGQKQLGVIWVDARPGLGNCRFLEEGMFDRVPLALLSGMARARETGAAFDWIKDEHRIRLGKLVYIGLREVSHNEAMVIDRCKIKHFAPESIDHLGIREVMDQALDYLGRDTPIHFAFGIHSLDPSGMLGATFPVSGGLTLREAGYIARRLHMSGQLISMDLVDVNITSIEQSHMFSVMNICVGIIILALVCWEC